MIELGFSVIGAERVEHAAVPTLRFALEISSVVPVRSVLLDVQLQIAARRRGYDAAANDRLFELFGPVADWGTSLRTLLWTRTTLVVPAFSEPPRWRWTSRARTTSRSPPPAIWTR